MNKYKKIVRTILVAFMMVFLLSGCQKKDSKEAELPKKKEQGTITVAINNNVPPFSYMKNDKVVGAEVDIWNYIGKKLDKKIEFDPAGFDVLFGKIDNKEVDFLSSYLAINPTRKEKYNFTAPYAHGFYEITCFK